MAKTKKTIWRNDKKLAQDIATGSSAMSVTFDPEGSAVILQVNLHLDIASATAEDIVINLDSDNGTAYDVNIVTEDMNAVADLILNQKDLEDYIVFEGDKITFTWTNTNARTWGLEVIYRRYES